MKTVLFVHGTGVREAGYNASFALVQQGLNAALGPMRVRTDLCYWGDNCGTGLFLQGRSIPRSEPAPDDEAAEGDYERGLWATLYENPAAEIQMLALNGVVVTPAPGRRPPGVTLRQHFDSLWPNFALLDPSSAKRLRAHLAASDLNDRLEPAWQEIRRLPSLGEALSKAQQPLTQYRLALARAVVAAAIRGAWDSGDWETGAMPFNASRRDAIVELLAAALGPAEKGVFGALAKRLFARAGTRWFAHRRRGASDALAPIGGDIIAYQARPKPMRDFIRSEIERASNEAKAGNRDGRVFLLAHSLGGVAAFETLVESEQEAVAGLITVGSQAPLLHELDALGTLPLPRGADQRPTGEAAALPDHFRYPWLNLYDEHDFLAYCAAPIFGGDRVTDVRVDNRQPFPESHSAYWSNKELWSAVAKFVKAHG